MVSFCDHRQIPQWRDESGVDDDGIDKVNGPLCEEEGCCCLCNTVVEGVLWGEVVEDKGGGC